MTGRKQDCSFSLTYRKDFCKPLRREWKVKGGKKNCEKTCTPSEQAVVLPLSVPHYSTDVSTRVKAGQSNLVGGFSPHFIYFGCFTGCTSGCAVFQEKSQIVCQMFRLTASHTVIVITLLHYMRGRGPFCNFSH